MICIQPRIQINKNVGYGMMCAGNLTIVNFAQGQQLFIQASAESQANSFHYEASLVTASRMKQKYHHNFFDTLRDAIELYSQQDLLTKKLRQIPSFRLQFRALHFPNDAPFDEDLKQGLESLNLDSRVATHTGVVRGLCLDNQALELSLQGSGNRAEFEGMLEYLSGILARSAQRSVRRRQSNFTYNFASLSLDLSCLLQIESELPFCRETAQGYSREIAKSNDWTPFYD